MQVVPSVILVCTSLADIKLMCSSNFYFIIILFSVSSYCALSRKTCDTLSHRIFNLPPLAEKESASVSHKFLACRSAQLVVTHNPKL